MRKYIIIEARSQKKLESKIEEFLDDKTKSLVNVTVSTIPATVGFKIIATVVYDLK